MKKTIITSACLLSLAAAQIATASPVLTSSVGGQAWDHMKYLNLDGAPLGNAPSIGSLNSDVSYVLTPDAKFVQGYVDNEYARPYVSVNNDVNFESPKGNGKDATTYLTTGKNVQNNSLGAKVVLNFTSAQNYFGLLWGSIDSYNHITFYSGKDGTGSSQTFNGGQVYTPVTGDQEIQGTRYVNFSQLNDFQSVVFTSTQYAFEFDNVAYGNVPDGGTTMIMLGGVLCGIGAIRRRLSV